MAPLRAKDDSSVKKIFNNSEGDRHDVTHRMRSRGDHFSISLNKAALLQMSLSLWKELLFRVGRSLYFHHYHFGLVLPRLNHWCASGESLQIKPSESRSRHTFPRKYMYNSQEVSVWCFQILTCPLLLPAVAVKLRGEDEKCCKCL